MHKFFQNGFCVYCEMYCRLIYFCWHEMLCIFYKIWQFWFDLKIMYLFFQLLIAKINEILKDFNSFCVDQSRSSGGETKRCRESTLLFCYWSFPTDWEKIFLTVKHFLFFRGWLCYLQRCCYANLWIKVIISFKIKLYKYL